MTSLAPCSQNAQDICDRVSKLRNEVLSDPQFDMQMEVLLFVYSFICLLMQFSNVYGSNLYDSYLPLFLLGLCMISKRSIWRLLKASLLMTRITRGKKHKQGKTSLFVFSIGLMAMVAFNMISFSLVVAFADFRRNFVYVLFPVLVYIFQTRAQSIALLRIPSDANECLHWHIQSMLFSIFELCYYGGFLPFRIPQSQYHYFDTFPCWLLLLFMVLNVSLALVGHQLKYGLWEMILCARWCGIWKRVQAPSDPSASAVQKWTVGIYGKSFLVVHRGKYYLSCTHHNCSEPGSLLARSVAFVVSNVPLIHKAMLVLQVVMILVQFVFVYVFWDRQFLIALVVMIPASYVVLYMNLQARRSNIQMIQSLPKELLLR
eukprot:TRINITY_DN9612_c0_g1_i1.p1 TRINITY_DN9612_c0_g1~~TRINITY_DN9612_c0_g1_i1.p1  ORF type:complete len:374 (-),score=29.94 TRINITY_DN9612_c0_g1_i1:32-1153(-)